MAANGSAHLPRLRSEVVGVSRRLHAAGWVANHDGNVSVRLQGQRYLVTCTAISKADVDDASLIIVSEKGEVLEGRKKSFSELELHLQVFAERPEVQAVIHAHPPYATAFGLSGQSLDTTAMPEVVVSLGRVIPTVARALPRTPASREGVKRLAPEYDAILIQGNGALTWGDDLSQALLRMELVEHYARITCLARSLGSFSALGSADVEALEVARTKAGLGPKGRQAAEAAKGKGR